MAVYSKTVATTPLDELFSSKLFVSAPRVMFTAKKKHNLPNSLPSSSMDTQTTEEVNENKINPSAKRTRF